MLAGGRSSRMGHDKALLQFAGQPLVEHALCVLREARLSAAVAGARSSLAGFAPVVQDGVPGRGPLGGICAALASTSAHWAVFLPVDLPLLPASLVAFLLYHALVTRSAVTVAAASGFAQTFPAVLHRSTLPALEAELAAGRGGCYAAFQAAALRAGEKISIVAVESLVQAGQIAHPDALPAALWFLNVNTAQDLLRAERYRAAGIA